jgi:hypothetical protein
MQFAAAAGLLAVANADVLGVPNAPVDLVFAI